MVTVKIFMRGDAADLCIPSEVDREHQIVKFIQGLQQKDKDDLFSLFKRFAKTGIIPNNEKFRYEGEGIFAFKTKQVRVLGMFLPHARKRTQLLIHGFMKKSQKLPQGEYKKAQRFAKLVKDEGYEFER